MTRLINYLNENTRQILFDSLEKIEKKCGSYLKEARKRNFGMYSGRKRQGDKILIEKSVRKDRKPKDTPIEIHNRLDDMFEKKTGIRLRSNSLFCANDKDIAQGYGRPYYIFPMGKYQTWYNPKVLDLYAYFNNADVKKSLDIHITMTEPLKLISTKIKEDYEYEKLFNNYVENIVDGYKKGFPKKGEIEITLHCDKYLAVNYNWAEYAMRIKLGISFDEWLLERK